MTLQEITQFIDENRDNEKAYTIVNNTETLLAIIDGDFDAIGLSGIIDECYPDLCIEEIKLLKVSSLYMLEDHFHIEIDVTTESGVNWQETLKLYPATIYRSESVKQIVNSIQQDQG